MYSPFFILKRETSVAKFRVLNNCVNCLKGIPFKRKKFQNFMVNIREMNKEEIYKTYKTFIEDFVLHFPENERQKVRELL